MKLWCLGRGFLLRLDARSGLGLLLSSYLAQGKQPYKNEQKNHNKQNVFASHMVSISNVVKQMIKERGFNFWKCRQMCFRLAGHLCLVFRLHPICMIQRVRLR